MASAPSSLSIPGNSLQRMHVTRPKSAKGRTRTTPQGYARNVEAYSCCSSPPPPQLHTSRALSGPRLSQEDMPELIHQPLTRPQSSSLNRYKVLPSIGMAGSGDKVGEDLAQHTGALRLGAEPQAKALYRGQSPHAVRRDNTARGHKIAVRQEALPVPAIRQEASPVPTLRLDHATHSVTLREPLEHEPRLLLAVRSYTGQRFERYFRPSDTLHAVLAAAEEKTGMSCKNCSVESMEVPRRSFPNLSWTLQECGIPNKSVLCIHQVERD